MVLILAQLFFKFVFWLCEVGTNLDQPSFKNDDHEINAVSTFLRTLALQ